MPAPLAVRLRDGVRAARAAAEVARWRMRPGRILVHTMPKSGSTSVEAALAGAGVPALKTHFLGAGHERALARNRAAGVALPHHMHRERLLRRRLPPDLAVVSMVRDPVARELSTLFQAPWLFGLEEGDDAGALRLIHERIEAGTFCETWLRWFPEEIGGVLGVDRESVPFDRARGLAVLERTGLRLILLRTERLDGLAGALSDFVGRPLSPARENVRGEAGEGAYARARAGLRLPRAALDTVYASPWMRRFYTDDEIERLTGRWAA